jgi:hypothetical protein
LLRLTGLGWDETKQNINMPESWWKKARKVSFFFEMMFFHLYIKLEKMCDGFLILVDKIFQAVANLKTRDFKMRTI